MRSKITESKVSIVNVHGWEFVCYTLPNYCLNGCTNLSCHGQYIDFILTSQALNIIL